MSEYISLKEAAELEGVDYEAMKKRIARDTDYYYESRKVSCQSGYGSDLVEVSIESLSESARQKYERRKRDAYLRRKRAESNEPPWYVGLRLDWYLGRYKKEYHKKCALKTELEKYLLSLKEHKKETVSYADEFAAKHLGTSGRQLRRYLKAYREGCEWAELSSPDGNFEFYKVLCLCREPQLGKNSKLTEGMKTLLARLWSGELYQKNMQSFMQLYERFREECEAQGCEYIPSARTCKRYVDEHFEYGGRDIKALIRGGERGLKHDAMMKKKRNTGALQVMELVQGDAHTFDCWVEYTKPDGSKTAIRPYLVGFIDTRSRCLVGWGICAVPNSEVIKQVIIHMIYEKRGSIISGVPKVLYLDNGKDFTAETLTGRNRKERGCFELDATTKGFYAAAGISEYKRAMPYQPWSKAEIERFFGTVCKQFTNTIESYTGTLTGSRTDGKVVKDIEKMLERGELYSMSEFTKLFEEWLEKYHSKVHSGLKRQGEAHPTPLGVWKDAPHYIQAPPPMEYVLSLLGKSEYRVVTNVGINLNNRIFTSADLGRYIGERVIVRFNTAMDEAVCIYSASNGEYIGNAYTYEGIDIMGNPESDEELLNHYKNQRGAVKATKQRLSGMRGEVMLPDLTGEPERVTALPNDMQYREELKRRSEMSREVKKPQRNAEFVRKIGSQVFEELKKLG